MEVILNLSNIDTEQKFFAKNSNLSTNLETADINNLNQPESFFLSSDDILKNIRHSENFDKTNNQISLPMSNKHIFSHDIISINKNALIDFCIDSCDKLFLLEHTVDHPSYWVLKSVLNNEDVIDVSEKSSTIARKIICSDQFVFVLENDNESDIISAYSKDYLKLQFKISDLDDSIIDFDVDSAGNLIILGTKIQKISLTGDSSGFLEKTPLISDYDFPTAEFLSIDNLDNIYIMHSQIGQLTLFENNGDGDFTKSLVDVSVKDCISFDVFDSKNIFLCHADDDLPSKPLKFELFQNKLLKTSFEIDRLSLKAISNNAGDLVIATEPKHSDFLILQKFNFHKTYLSNSKISLIPLDSMHKGTGWHKLILDLGSISKKTSILVSYGASDVLECSVCKESNLSHPPLENISELKNHFEKTHEGKFSFENMVPPFEHFDDLLPNPKNALLNSDGRYLWLVIRLMTLDKGHSPELHSMRVHFPRISYLQYLPNIYGNDENSKRFLEQFLSLFEYFFDDMDKKIFNFHTLLDPKTAPVDFLPWLSAMLGVTYDDQWPELNFRNMLSRLPSIYQKRGTKDGLKELLSLFLSSNDAGNLLENKDKIMIFENFQLDCLKQNSFDRYDEYFDLYGDDPSTFSVLIDETILNSQKLEVVRKIVNNEKPAHALANVCPLTNWFYLGTHTYLGLNTVLGDQSFVVGTSALSRDTSI